MNKDNTGVIYTAIICITLIALILGSFFLVVMDEEKPTVQTEISVVLYYTGSDGWDSMLEGMKQAEDDFSININYVILRESADGAEQIAAIEKEIANDTEGLIIAVCDYESMYEKLEIYSNTVPMIAVESGVGDSMIPLCSADNYELGEKLAEQVMKDFAHRDDLVIAMGSDGIKRDSVKQRKQGFLDALDGCVRVVSLNEAENGEYVDAAVAFHKEALYELTENDDLSADHIRKYGIGSTLSIVAALDKGNLEKLVFQNEFNMGYLAVEAIVKNISGERIQLPESMDIYCVNREEVYLPQYEQLLFPIVE